MTSTVVTCANCERVLDEDPGLTTKPPCPYCGSTRRNIQVHMTATAKAYASVALMRVRETVERNWFWTVVVLALAAGSVLAKFFLPFWLALVVAVALAALGLALRPRASARVIERDHFKPD